MVQQPSEPFAPASTSPSGSRRKGMLIAGLVVLIGGVGGGAAAFVTAGSQVEDGVKSLARAPVGCTTTLEFDKAGTFTVFVETKGSIGSVRGDCSNTEATYDRGGSSLPDVTLTMVNDSGDEVSLDDGVGASYDAAGFVGKPINSVTIDAAGTFELTVASDESDFAVSVGKNPKQSGAGLKTIGLAAMIGGGVLGLALILLGLRRKASGPATLQSPPPGAPGGAPQQWAAQQPGAYAPAPTSFGVAPPQQQQPIYIPPAQQPAPAPAPSPPPMAPGGWPQPPQG